MRSLYIQLSRDFNKLYKDSEILPLGPLYNSLPNDCTPYVTKEWINNYHEIDIELVHSTCDDLISKIYIYLNEYSKCSYDFLFWKKLLHYWLCTYLTSFYYCYSCYSKVLSFLADHENEYDYIYTVIEEQENIDILSQKGFINLAFQEKYKSFLYDKLIKSNRVIDVKHCKKSIKESRLDKTTSRFDSTNVLLKLLFRFFLNFNKGSRILYSDMFFPQEFVYKVTNHTFGSVKPLLTCKDSSKHLVDIGCREQLRVFLDKTKKPADEWVDSAIVHLPDCLPVYYLEVFSNTIRYCEKFLSERPNIKALVSSTASSRLDYPLFIGALISEKGGDFIGVSHGWGHSVVKGVIEEELCCYDEYYCIGKSSMFMDDFRIKEAPLHRYLGANQLKNGDTQNYVLYGGTTVFPDSSYCYEIFFKTSQIRYVERRYKFIDGLKKESLANIIFRERPEAYFNMEQLLKDRYGDLVRFSETAFECMNKDPERRIRGFLYDLNLCSLYITDCISTTIAEALYADIPLMLILDEQAFSFYPQLQPYVNELIDNDILFYDPQKAADCINNIIDNVAVWWNEPRRRECVEKIKQVFLTNLHNVDKFWINEFKRIMTR